MAGVNLRCAMLIWLLASAAARAEVAGTVYEILNPQAPRTEWQRRPLPGAYVSLTWSTTIPAPAHATSWCRHSEIARANEKGEYAMQGPIWLTRAMSDLIVGVYAPGYEGIHLPYDPLRESGKEIPMAKSTLPAEQRIGRLHAFLGCGSDHEIHDPKRLLPQYLRSLADEAKALNVQSPYGKTVTQHLETIAQRHDPAYRPPGSTPLRVELKHGAIEGRSPSPQ